MSSTSSDWRSSVAYQIYPRSFADSNGDGIGDIPGITAHLDHLQALGIEIVWLSPVYDSPNDDNGYDIRDYRSIMKEFGTMADFDAMLAGMRQRGIRLMMDLVVNHTSDEHAWFQQARSSRDNPYHDYYIWRDPVEGREPTNWEAAFNGSAWTFNEATGEYYLHMFSKKQPDLNWENPKVRQEVYDLMHFWLKKGVGGFRMDVINMISKPWQTTANATQASLPDAPKVQDGFLQPAFEMVTHGPRFMSFMREMRREVLDHYDCITVGEAPCATIAQAQEITHPQTGALNMVFQFEHMEVDSQPGKSKWDLKPLHLPDLKASLSRWQTGLQGQGWNSLYWCNHDQPRAVSRFGDEGPYRVRSAKLLATCLHMMQGTPFIYQGEELGMTNVKWPHIDQYQDIETRNMFQVAVVQKKQHPERVMQSIHAKGRDNARTPMQWSSAPQAGFTTGQPWLAVHDNYTEVNAAQARADDHSIFHYYRELIALRKKWPVMVSGNFELLLPKHAALFAYTRRLGDVCLLVLCNFSSQFQGLPLKQLPDFSQAQALIGNLPVEEWPLAPDTLAAWEARVYVLA
ncbi:MAG: Oligo,6-glucosidase [Pseudomonadota bacterium]|jgi:oligo-1,6-glucosidase